jgi:hypothetical protein
MKWLDAAMISVAAGLTFLTVALSASDYPAAFVPKAPAVVDSRPRIVLTSSPAGCAYVVGPGKALRSLPTPAGTQIRVAVDRADRAVLVSFLARLCRTQRIPAERIAGEAGLVAEVARAILR